MTDSPQGKKSNISRIYRNLIETPIYTLGINLFECGVKIASRWNPKAKLMIEGHKSIWKTLLNETDLNYKYIWIHAASLGEFEQGRPLIEMLREKAPEYKILLTFFSPSGYEVRKNYDLADVVCYLPFDKPANVRGFLDIVRPIAAIFIKYEFWRNYLYELNKRGIPTYIISAVFRTNQLFFKKIGKPYANLLQCFDFLYLQDEKSNELLNGIGITNTLVCGDTRFDRVSDIRSNGKQIPVLEDFTKHIAPSHNPVIMVGSSWPEDEAVYSEWANENPNVKFVIAPHEFDKKRLDSLKKLFTNGAILKSEVEENPSLMENAQVLIIDCFGLLSSAYAYCDIAYVGGGFGAGIHNINEPAVFDVPVIYGPNNKKFIEAKELEEAGGGFPITGKADFNRIAEHLASSPQVWKKKGLLAGNYIRSKTGATNKIYKHIFKKTGKVTKYANTKRSRT